MTSSTPARSAAGDGQPGPARGGLIEIGDDLAVEQQHLVLPVQHDPLRRHPGRHCPIPHRQHSLRFPTHTSTNDTPPTTVPAHGATSPTTNPARSRPEAPSVQHRTGVAEQGESDKQSATALIVELAALAGRRIDDIEIATVLAWSQDMPAQRANEIWRRQQRAPATVSLRDYLAMTLRFITQAPSA